MKAIIFGVQGQDGRYLSRLLESEGFDVVGVGRSSSALHNIANQWAVNGLVGEHKPELIFHLAANSTTNHAAAYENHETIGTGALNILEAVRRYSSHSRVFLAGSCLQFVNDGRPMSEDNQLAADSGYAAVRNYTLFLARYYRAIVELKVYFGFLFHHESPYRKDRHVSRIIAGAARKAAAGDAVMLEMDDLDACREWTFAGDVVEAIWKLVSQDRIFEVCIGTGHPRTVAEFAHACFGAVGLNWTDHVTERPDMVNGRRAKQISANPGLVRSIGWQPRTGIQDLAQMMVTAPVGAEVGSRK